MFASGQSCRQFVILLSGSVRVQLTTKTGRNLHLFDIEAGQSCALTNACLLTQSRYYAEGIALANVTFASIDQGLFQQCLNTSHSFAKHLLQDYASRIGLLTQQIDRLAQRELDDDLIKYLHEHAVDQRLKLSHQAIAEDLGTAREVVSRKLKKLEQQGLLKLGRGQLWLL